MITVRARSESRVGRQSDERPHSRQHRVVEIRENMKNTLQFTMCRGRRDGVKRAKRFMGGGGHGQGLTSAVGPTLHDLIQQA